MVVCAPQIDPRILAGAAVIFSSVFFGAHSNTAMGAEYQFGTHAQAIHQSQNKTQIWGSVRTPPAAAASPLAQWFAVPPQRDPSQVQSLLWKPQQAEQGNIVLGIDADPQRDPNLIQPQIFKSAPATVITASYAVNTRIATGPQADPSQVQSAIYAPTFNPQGKLGATFVTRPQDDPSQIAPQIYRSVIGPSIPLRLLQTGPQIDLTPQQNFWPSAATPPVAVSGVLASFILSAPQSDPTQLPSLLWTPRTTSAARFWPLVQTAPQADPTQIAPQVYASVATPPAILGPTVTQFVLGGQPDLNINYTVLWTPSTFSPSGPPPAPVADQNSGGWWPDYSHVRRVRDEQRQHREEIERGRRKIQDATDREIARLLAEQEAKDADRADLQRLQALADKYAGQKLDLPKPVTVAILNASDARTRNALEQLLRVIEQLEEEEHIALIAALLLDDE